MLRRPVLPWGALCVLIFLAFAAGGAERGFPLITVYPPEVHKAGPQMFDIAQDSRGVLLFGSLHGLASYDGAWWELRKLPDEQVVLAVASDSQGRVALGLLSDFGFLERDATGSYGYRSLLSTLPAAQRQVGDIRDICTTPVGFLFVAERSLLVWNGGVARSVATFTAEEAPRGCYSDGPEIFLRGPRGLQRLDPQSFQVSAAGLDLRVVHIYRRVDGTLVAVTRNDGLFLAGGGPATPFAPEVKEWLKGKAVTGGTRLRDGRVVVTTRQHGLVIFDDAGVIEQVIRADAGLPDAVLTHAFEDREGSLWLAMEGPIVRVDLASPVTVFDVRRGVRGAAGDVAFFKGLLYAATTHGVYEVDAGGNARRIEPVEDAWRVLPVDDELLIGTSKGIFRRTSAGKAEQVVKMERELYDLHRSAADPSRVWLALGDGIGSIRREGTNWIFEGLIAGVDQSVATIVERDGGLWAGTVFNGILRVTNPRAAKPQVVQFGKGEMNVYDVDGRAVFVRATGQVVQIGPDGKLIPDERLGHLQAPRGFFVVEQDERGAMWINSTPPRVYEKQSDGSFTREGRPLVSVSATDIQNIRATSDGTVWFASDKGLFRYRPTVSGEVFAAQPPPLLRRVTAGEGQVLVGGASMLPGQPVSLKHNFGRIRIEFAPASYRPGVEYQYRLDPIDEEWSAWTEQPFIDYTTLAANDYAFRLRARGAGSAPSAEARWTFSVLPSWYSTRLAKGLGLLMIAAIVLLVFRMRTSALRRQAERLRARVEEQTAELQETVKLLESANTRLEALSLEDDLTGISNRRYFERALADEWNRARRREHPLALVLLDLDNFKDLNDRRGHPAGDDCLRRVGAFLSETIRRSGEVVARYGGEEFAILLPGVDADVAIRVAETLREGIERLAIPYGNGAGRRVTASCGVAAITPGPDVSAENLVAGADRALYAAKHSGRNCVRVADETTTGTWLRNASA